MLQFTWITVLVCTVYSAHTITAQLALDFEKCPFGDSACHVNVVNLLLKKAKTGARELNLIPFDPLRVKSLKINPNTKSPINIEISFKNIEIIGLQNLQNIKVDGFTHDVQGPILLEGTLPQAIIRGPYQGGGTVLGLPFKGSGKCEIVLKNIKLTAKLNGKLVTKGADRYLTFKDISLAISDPENVHFQFGGLFDGNKDLSDTAHAFLNENWKEIFRELRPAWQEAFAKILEGFSKNVFIKPYDWYFKQ
ncbi:protein takeout-like [Rhagoletis pomonella]|uniref:protein takeout-like n=1 Tax=Rhagoletis pomonella TaxID=28610 RepID=UPI00177C7CD9|nr:protein takeout-like [Rhagoletis pomonella]XP_036343576.1 protein takeout-like [Rhagoletis pomonella]